MQNKLEIENNRNQENINKIYLFKDSNNSPWYKAYNWSAYLLEFYNNELDDKNKLKPTHKSTKENKDTVVYVGLQFTSFKKFLPNLEPIITEEYTEFSIDLTKFEELLSFDNYVEILNNWKKEIPVKEQQNKQKEKHDTVYSKPSTFTSIMRNILVFNTTNKTQDELLDFIVNIKEQCANIIC